MENPVYTILMGLVGLGNFIVAGLIFHFIWNSNKGAGKKRKPVNNFGKNGIKKIQMLNKALDKNFSFD